MKKLIKYSAICIIAIAGVLFSSCGSNMSVTKRHYNKGYYIARSNGKQTKLTKEEGKTVQGKTRQTLYSIQNLEEQNVISGYSGQSPLKDNKLIVASNKKMQRKVISQPGKRQTLKQNAIIFRYPAVQIKQALSETKKVSGSSSDRDGLSLFWIIILVILILWAIGFWGGGFGLGALINLLLLVALILFILWLFRIL